ncbi:MAG: tetratricopeptide repeat protein [Kiritimatiellae bacterium]|nr:tetratricopeptide repeat protein [Kiritimatiellia bacterium]
MASGYRHNQLRCCQANAWRIVVFCLSFAVLSCFLCGCGTIGQRKSRVSHLSGEDKQFADALAHYCQGIINRNTLGDNSPQTLKEYQRASELDPKNNMLHTITAASACRQNVPDLDTGRTHYLKAIELAPSEATLYIALARLYFYQKKDKEALSVLADGFKSSDSETIILAFTYGFARTFIAKNNVNRAIPCVEFLAAQSKHSRRYYHLLGDLHTSLDNKKAAIHNYLMATKDKKSLPESFISLAAIYAESAPDKAEKTLLKGASRLPDNTFILLALSRLYSIQKQFDKSLDVFAKIKNIVQNIQNNTITADLYIEYGSTLDMAGRKEDAEKIFLECIKIHPNADQALNYLAYMWAEQDIRLEIALKYVNRALTIEPVNGAYIDTLGWIYYKQKKYDMAIERLLKAAFIIKNDPVITEHIGDTYNALNNNEKARHFWLLSHKLDPESQSVKKKLAAQGVDIKTLTSKITP